VDDIERFRSPGTYPSVDESFDRLHRAGWSIGETAFGSDHSLVWIVSGSNGDVDEPYCLHCEKWLG
jgi:hypothetical protein